RRLSPIWTRYMASCTPGRDPISSVPNSHVSEVYGSCLAGPRIAEPRETPSRLHPARRRGDDMLLILRSWMWILYFDYLMLVRGFDAVHAAVRSQRCTSLHSPITDHAAICHAVDLACVFYFKPVLCLQRSAATILLLRRHG